MNLNKLNLNAVKKKQYVVILGLILFLLFVYYLWVYLYELKIRCEEGDPTVKAGLCKILGWVPKPPFYGTKDNIVALLIAAVVPIAMIFVGALLVSAFPIVAAVLLLGGLIIGTLNLYLNQSETTDPALPDNIKLPD